MHILDILPKPVTHKWGYLVLDLRSIMGLMYTKVHFFTESTDLVTTYWLSEDHGPDNMAALWFWDLKKQRYL